MLATIGPDTWWIIILAWAITVVAIVGYAAIVIRRGKRLSAQVPPDARRWM